MFMHYTYVSFLNFCVAHLPVEGDIIPVFLILIISRFVIVSSKWFCFGDFFLVDLGDITALNRIVSNCIIQARCCIYGCVGLHAFDQGI